MSETTVSPLSTEAWEPSRPAFTLHNKADFVQT